MQVKCIVVNDLAEIFTTDFVDLVFDEFSAEVEHFISRWQPRRTLPWASRSALKWPNWQPKVWHKFQQLSLQFLLFVLSFLFFYILILYFISSFFLSLYFQFLRFCLIGLFLYAPLLYLSPLYNSTTTPIYYYCFDSSLFLPARTSVPSFPNDSCVALFNSVLISSPFGSVCVCVGICVCVRVRVRVCVCVCVYPRVCGSNWFVLDDLEESDADQKSPKKIRR